MVSCEYYIELLSAGLDEQLTQEQERELADHLVSCPACRELGPQLAAAHAAFAGLEELEAPEGFARGVMDRIRAEESRKKIVPLFRRPQVRALGGLAACAVLCVGIFGGGMVRSDSKKEAMAPAAEAPMASAPSAVSSPASAPAEARDNTVFESEYAMGCELAPAESGEEQKEVPHVSMPLSGEKLPVDSVSYLRLSWSGEDIPSTLAVLEQSGDLEALLGEAHGWQTQELKDRVDCAIEEGPLLAVLVVEPSSSVSHEVDAVTEDLVVLRRIVPEAGDCDMAAWLILIGVDEPVSFDTAPELIFVS